MTPEEAIEILQETGEYLNTRIGTDSYEQRCRLFDATKVVERMEASLSAAKKALQDIKDWDDDLEDMWEDAGYRAIGALEDIKELAE